MKYLKLFVSLLSKYIYFFSWNIKNVRHFNKKRILIFTDSRGFKIGKALTYKNGFFNPLYEYLSNNFFVSIDINNFKHTTYLDFIYKYGHSELRKFDHIILILGVVDFSPRPASEAKKIRKLKSLKNKFKIADLDKRFMTDNEKYEGQLTDSIMNKNLEYKILNYLADFKQKIIQISTNNIDHDWDGNYWRKRPKNMNVQMKKEQIFAKKLSNMIITFEDLKSTKDYTVDNIHYNQKGFSYIRDQLKLFLE